MGEYVWVREHTKKGFPHFHFIAEWNTSKWFFQEIVYQGKSMPRITAISLYWSGLFGSIANNSVRMGSYHPATQKRTLYVTHSKQCWYLAKYIGKSIGDNGHDSYLCEAGFPATKYKRAVRSFAISEMLREWSQATLFKATYVNRETGEVIYSILQTAGTKVEIDRVFHSWNSGLLIELTEREIETYKWRWTGHGETYIGYKRFPRLHRPRKGGNKSD
jgi:hypothetical protein